MELVQQRVVGYNKFTTNRNSWVWTLSYTYPAWLPLPVSAQLLPYTESTCIFASPRCFTLALAVAADATAVAYQDGRSAWKIEVHWCMLNARLHSSRYCQQPASCCSQGEESFLLIYAVTSSCRHWSVLGKCLEGKRASDSGSYSTRLHFSPCGWNETFWTRLGHLRP